MTAAAPEPTLIEGLYIGQGELLGPEGQRSGIFKRPVSGRIRVDLNGLAGDVQVDRRVHGGPQKAVHQYAMASYARLAAAFAQASADLVPGSLGENLSAAGMDDGNVHIGDVYQVGDAILQVSQPRRPCWKINHRFGIEQLSVHIAEHRLTGWYYRVLQPGELAVGDRIALIERRTERFSIDRFWQVQSDHRPDLDELMALAQVSGLAPEWRGRLENRAQWLRAQGRTA